MPERPGADDRCHDAELRQGDAQRTLVEVLQRKAFGAQCHSSTNQQRDYYASDEQHGPITSFESLSHLFAELERRSRADPRWRAEQLALGASPGLAEMNVTAGPGYASSLLPMTDNVRTHAPDQPVVRSESVRVSTIDEVVKQHYPSGDRLFLKIDVQGYERRVLEGARATMPRIVGLRLELSLVENYRGESLLVEMLPMLYALGFRAVAIETAWANPTTRELFQVDVTCFRTDRVDGKRLRSDPAPA